MTNIDSDNIVNIIKQTYEEIPYVSLCFPNTQPERLAATVKLFGLTPAPVTEARVLEIGCSSGGNLIPFAIRNPNSQCLGIDLSERHIADANARIRDLALHNMKAIRIDLAKFPADSASFDYVICHGVYSWVPDSIKDAILRLISNVLSPQGVGLISYNVLPGWRLPQIMRDSFFALMPSNVDINEEAKRAREIMRLVGENCSSSQAWRFAIEQGCNRISSSQDYYLCHEFLEKNNDPITFRQFIEAINHHSLTYVADVDISTMFLERFAANTAEAITQFTSGDFVLNEQVGDILTGRLFRQSILVKSEQNSSIVRTLTPASIEGLSFSPQSDLTISRNASGGEIRSSTDAWVKFSSHRALAFAESIVNRYPASTKMDDIIASHVGMDERFLAQDAILKMAVFGLGVLTSEPVVAAKGVDDIPLATNLARHDAERKLAWTTNLRSESVNFEGLDHFLLPLLDGTRSLGDLTEFWVSKLIDPTVYFSDNIRNGYLRQGRSFIQAQLVEQLKSLAFRALLMPRS